MQSLRDAERRNGGYAVKTARRSLALPWSAEILRSSGEGETPSSRIVEKDGRNTPVFRPPFARRSQRSPTISSTARLTRGMWSVWMRSMSHFMACV